MLSVTEYHEGDLDVIFSLTEDKYVFMTLEDYAAFVDKSRRTIIARAIIQEVLMVPARTHDGRVIEVINIGTIMQWLELDDFDLWDEITNYGAIRFFQILTDRPINDYIVEDGEE